MCPRHEQNCAKLHLYILDGNIMDTLFCRLYRLLTVVQSVQLRVVLVQFRRTNVQKFLYGLLVFDDGLAELGDLVIPVFVEGAENADARLARLAVEAYLRHGTIQI